jgi:hypothetical protein
LSGALRTQRLADKLKMPLGALQVVEINHLSVECDAA